MSAETMRMLTREPFATSHSHACDSPAPRALRKPRRRVPSASTRADDVAPERELSP